MRLEHSFTVPADLDTVWKAVLDPQRVTPCMPGASLTSVTGTLTGLLSCVTGILTGTLTLVLNVAGTLVTVVDFSPPRTIYVAPVYRP